MTEAIIQGSDFARLSERVKQAGLLKPRPLYYACRIGLVAAAYAGAWTIFVLLGDSWYQTIVALALAVIFAQVALVAHDIAHRQVWRARRHADIAGLVAGNLAIGMSYGWWMDKHTRHHASPNHPEADPGCRPGHPALVHRPGTRQQRLLPASPDSPASRRRAVTQRLASSSQKDNAAGQYVLCRRFAATLSTESGFANILTHPLASLALARLARPTPNRSDINHGNRTVLLRVPR